METVNLFYDLHVGRTRFPFSFPQIDCFHFSLKRRRLLFSSASGLTVDDLPPLLQWARTHVLPDEEHRAHAILPLLLLDTPDGRRCIESALAGLGLNRQFLTELSREIADCTLHWYYHGRSGVDVSVDLDLFVVEEVAEEGGGGEEVGANSFSTAHAARRTILRDRMEKEYGESNGESCSICLEEFAETSRVMNMPCSHIFHSDCILTWLDRHNSCPLCRSQFSFRFLDGNEEE